MQYHRFINDQQYSSYKAKSIEQRAKSLCSMPHAFYIMEADAIKSRGVESEFVFSASRSSGPGGQNVNKVSSKVELRFNLWASAYFSYIEKQLIYQKLGNKINQRGELVIESQTERSQIRNKEKVTEKFFILIAKALTVPKKRKPTRPSKGSKLRRLESKKKQGDKKAMRKRPDY